MNIKQYASKAEQLKLQEKENGKPKLNISLSTEECMQKWPGLSKALKYAINGKKFDDNKQYDKALVEYDKGIKKLMDIFGNTDINEKINSLSDKGVVWAFDNDDKVTDFLKNLCDLNYQERLSLYK